MVKKFVPRTECPPNRAILNAVVRTVSGGTGLVGAHVARLATRVPSRGSETATMLNQAARENLAEVPKDQHTETATWGIAMHATKRCRIIWGSVGPVTHGFLAIQS